MPYARVAPPSSFLPLAESTKRGEGRRLELKAFLQARRAAISPENEGLSRGARRRAPGLRREELVAIARVGLTWYTWLEQGREIQVSREMLVRVSRALRLSSSDEAYLFMLALADTPAPHATSTHEEVAPLVRAAVQGFRSGPAYLFAPNFDVLCHNDLWDAVYSSEPYIGPFAHNHLWRAFMDPARRRLLEPDFELSARNLVGIFLLRRATHLGEPAFEQLLSALLANSEFSSVWNRREPLLPAEHPVFKLDHPTLGPLSFCAVRFALSSAAGTTLSTQVPADDATTSAMAKVLRERHGPPPTGLRVRR